MKATDELRQEHTAIEQMLQALEAAAARILRREPVPVADLEAMVEFLSVFADRCHHGKEEEFLFPALEAAGIGREGGPIGVMLYEHTQGRALIARLGQAIGGIKSGSEAASADFAAAARDYAALLRQHIDKENNVLFFMAQARLSDAQDEELMRAFERVERERIGAGKHQEFHALLDRFRRQYLNSGR